MDSHCRSIAKTISWRVVSPFITGSVVWAVTGTAKLGAVVGIVDTIVKFGLFYAHERAWNRISYGCIEPPDYEI